jgi:hypothetical protein
VEPVVFASMAALFCVSISSLWVYTFLNASARFRYVATAAAVVAAVVVAVVVIAGGGPKYCVVLYPGLAYSAIMFAAWRVHAVRDALEVLRRP